MRRTSLGVLLFLLAPLQAARAQAEEQVPPLTEPTAPSAETAPVQVVGGGPADKFQVGVAILPMVLGRVTTGPGGDEASSKLDAGYGVGLSFGYRILAGLSVGLAPQVVFHLTAKDSAGYPVITSEKEYDLMARIAYAYRIDPNVEVVAEVLPGYSFVTYNQIVLGSQAPRARGVVVGGGLGAVIAITERFFANAGVGYQVGFQTSHGISDRGVKTKFLRIALGGGVKF